MELQIEMQTQANAQSLHSQAIHKNILYLGNP